MLNYQRWGSQESHFDMMTSGGDVTAENVIALIKSDVRTEGGPIVEMLTPEMHDFGAMSMGEVGNKVFKIKNVGNEPMTLRVGNSTCKCTIGKLASDKLMPGEQTDINIEWTVKSDKTEFEQRAQIITNDPNKVAIDLRIMGNILRKIEYSPPKIMFGDVPAGQGFDINTKIYSYFDNDIVPIEAKFTSQQMQDLADVQLTPFEVTEEDGSYSNAKQGFEIKAKVKSGMRQGAVTTYLRFQFKQNGEDGFLKDQETGEDLVFHTDGEIVGRIIGSMRMIEGPKLRSVASGGYIYKFGKLTKDSKLTAKALVVLKGSEKDKTNLSLGEVTPKKFLKAELGEARGRGEDTVLFPLTLEIVPGDEPGDFMGKGRNEYGKVWIESDNPKVPRMLVAVKFSIDEK